MRSPIMRAHEYKYFFCLESFINLSAFFPSSLSQNTALRILPSYNQKISKNSHTKTSILAIRISSGESWIFLATKSFRPNKNHSKIHEQEISKQQKF